jgi:hypothetical protein
MSGLGLLLFPCCAGSLETLVVLGEFPNRIPEFFHLKFLPQVTGHLGQLQFLHHTGFLGTLVLLALFGILKFPQVRQGLLQLRLFSSKY